MIKNHDKISKFLNCLNLKLNFLETCKNLELFNLNPKKDEHILSCNF